METRKCWKCKRDKELTSEFFSKDSIDRTGFQKTCKICQKESMKLYREKNPNYFKEQGKKRYKKEDNQARYQKYKTQYLERRDEQRITIRGRMYDLLESARGRAKNKNLPIDIDLDFLINLYEQQGGKCKLTDINFTFEINKDRTRKFLPFNPSLDKIDCNKGYTKDNVRLVCTIVNLALNNFGEDTFKMMCQAYINKSTN